MADNKARLVELQEKEELTVEEAAELEKLQEEVSKEEEAK